MSAPCPRRANLPNPLQVPPESGEATERWLVTGLVFVGAVVFTLLTRSNIVVGIAALFLLFVPLEKVINTPEWHHWHHAVDAEARDKHFGLPVIDKMFGTAYMPRDRHPRGFGTDEPVPESCYLRHLAYPFTRRARALRY